MTPKQGDRGKARRAEAEPVSPSNSQSEPKNDQRKRSVNRIAYSTVNGRSDEGKKNQGQSEPTTSSPPEDSKHTKDEPALFKTRDGDAANELMAICCEAGGTFGTTILLYPSDKRPLNCYPAVGQHDWLLLATRPPINDSEPKVKEGQEITYHVVRAYLEKRTRRAVPAAACEFQQLMFEGLSRYLLFCSRKFVILTSKAMAFLKPDASRSFGLDSNNWLQAAEFFEYSWEKNRVSSLCSAELKSFWFREEEKLVSPDRAQHYSLVYLIRIESLPKLRGSLICCFGMNAITTLIWARIVRLEYPHLVTTPGDRFVMGQLVLKKSLEHWAKDELPVTPMFNDSRVYADVNLLTREPLA